MIQFPDDVFPSSRSFVAPANLFLVHYTHMPYGTTYIKVFVLGFAGGDARFRFSMWGGEADPKPSNKPGDLWTLNAKSQTPNPTSYLQPAKPPLLRKLVKKL